MPDSLRIGLIAAKEMWESKISTLQPIIFEVEMSEMEPDLAMTAWVGYWELEESGVVLPSSLIAQTDDNAITSEYSPNAFLTLNAGIDWNCSFATSQSPGVNAYTIGLRAIALGLGFGSSITSDGMTAQYQEMWPSGFDYMIHFNGQQITELDDEMLMEAITSDELFVSGETEDHPLYAPRIYEYGRSLIYLKDPGSLMHYAIGDGDKFFSIDNATLDILKKIGWEFEVNTDAASIACLDISDDGIGSSYSPHTFFLKGENLSISSTEWNFYVKHIDGTYQLYSSGSDETFKIPAISPVDGLYINLNGDIEGRVECKYISEGNKFSANPFTVSLELKPEILDITELTELRLNKPNAFSLRFNVRYRGAESVNIYIEEEYDGNIRWQRVDEPYLAHIETGNISSLYYSWVDVTVTNKYGSDTRTLEFAPNYDNIDDTTGVDSVIHNDTSIIELYTMQGVLIFTGNMSSFQNLDLAKGIYLMVTTSSDGIIQTRKIYR